MSGKDVDMQKDGLGERADGVYGRVLVRIRSLSYVAAANLPIPLCACMAYVRRRSD